MAEARGPSAGAVVALAARALVRPPEPGTLAALTANPLDWDSVLCRAEDERLAPVLFSVLQALPVPAPIRDRLRPAWVAATRQHLLGTQQLRATLDALGNAGVAAIPLKGPALAEHLYGQPGLRPFTDLDILVRRGDVSAALGVLASLGYRHLGDGRPLEHELAEAAGACFVHEGPEPGLPVDLHWELLAPPGVMRRSPIPVAEVWERAVPAGEWGPLVYRLQVEDLLLYLALHLTFHHPLGGLRWHLDIALLLRRFGPTLDWAAVAERAGRWRVRTALAFGLSSVRAGLGAEAVPPLPDPLRPGPVRGAMMDWLARREPEPDGRLDYVAGLLATDRLRDVAGTVVASAFPPVAWLRARYGARGAIRSYVTHYTRAARICVRALHAGVTRPRGAGSDRLRGHRDRG